MAKNKLIEHHILPFAFNPLSRRLFLKSSTGFIALPFISSLLPKEAWAAEEEEALYRRMVFMINSDGNNYLDCIPRNVAYQSKGTNIMAGSLKNAELGPIYNSDYQNLKNKLSIIMGLAAPTGANHSQSTPLAAGYSGYQYNKNEGDYKVTGAFSLVPNSIDEILSKKLYRSSHPNFLKVLRFTGQYSYTESSRFEGLPGVPQYRSPSSMSNGAIRNLLMQNTMIGASVSKSEVVSSSVDNLTAGELENEKRRYIIERALASLSVTRQSGRISTSAKSKISNYQEMLAMVRDGIPQPSPSTGGETGGGDMGGGNTGGGDTGGGNTGGGMTGGGSTGGSDIPTGSVPTIKSCGDIAQSSDQKKEMAHLVLTALACGATRLAVCPMDSNHELAHKANSGGDNGVGGGRDDHLKFMRDTALPIGGYLMKLMDQVQESNGNTLLENSGVLITSTIGSSSTKPHNGHSMRVLVGGGLNGKLRMGEAINFQDTRHQILTGGWQNVSSQGVRGDEGIEQVSYAGRPYNELLITFMRAFGLNQADYSHKGAKGYGQYHIDEVEGSKYWYGIHIPNDESEVQPVVLNYFKNVFLKNYNRDSALSYYFSG